MSDAVETKSLTGDDVTKLISRSETTDAGSTGIPIFQGLGENAILSGDVRRWELAGINPAVIRQQMGHASAAMTARYTGEIPIEQVRSEFSTKFGFAAKLLEKTGEMENETAA